MFYFQFSLENKFVLRFGWNENLKFFSSVFIEEFRWFYKTCGDVNYKSIIKNVGLVSRGSSFRLSTGETHVVVDETVVSSIEAIRGCEGDGSQAGDEEYLRR